MGKKVLIIGAGMAGLSAGCYAQMNGYQSEIIEMHDQPGGFCTSWKRRGYVFDGCIHWLVGSSPDNPFYDLWEEIGAVQGRRLIHRDEFARVESKEGRTLIVYSDFKRLEKHLLELSPADELVIRRFISMAKLFSVMKMPMDKPRELYSPVDGVKMLWQMLPYLNSLRKANNISIGDFAQQFKDPLLREGFEIMLVEKRYSLISLLFTLAWHHNRDAAFPEGGSLEFSRAIASRYESLGGKIHYRSRVKEIVVKKGQAAGVRLEEGQVLKGDWVVSAADGHTTIFKMLGGRYVGDKTSHYYNNMPLTNSSVQVSIGVDADLTGQPHAIYVPMEKPLDTGERKLSHIPIKHYCFDKSLSPPGKSVVVSLLESDFSWWEKIAVDPERYQAEKDRIAAAVIERLQQRYPVTKGRVEAIDVATPRTFNRYTGSWKGSYMSWIQTPGSGMSGIPRTLPGLDRFFMCGQWTMPSAGLPGSVLTGREVIQIMCKKDGQRFQASKP
ncbi:MAG: phytoene desaturase family protein [Bacillota bacterium]